MRLSFVGDVMLGRLVNRGLRESPPEYPWGDVLPVLWRADGLMANLECVISDRGEPWPGKLFTFRSDRKNVGVLERGRVSAVSLANNHALDFGDDALRECLDTLAAAGIRCAGAGLCLEAARAPAFFTARETNIALVAFTDNEPEWEALGTTPGVFHVPLEPVDGRFDVLLGVIREAKARADVVVVSAHWGGNWGEMPPAAHVDAARRLVEAGADVVFGHSAHVFRGIGFHLGKPILYSCGDFVDDYAVDEVERNDRSFVFSLDFDGSRVRRLVLVPTVIRNLQARMARGSERAETLDRMEELCAALGTRDFRETDVGLEILAPERQAGAVPER